MLGHGRDTEAFGNSIRMAAAIVVRIEEAPMRPVGKTRQ
jgi:hypothetical protein